MIIPQSYSSQNSTTGFDAVHSIFRMWYQDDQANRYLQGALFDLSRPEC